MNISMKKSYHRKAVMFKFTLCQCGKVAHISSCCLHYVAYVQSSLRRNALDSMPYEECFPSGGIVAMV